MLDSTVSTRPAVTAPDLEAFCELDGMGIRVVSQEITPLRAVLNCKIPRNEEFCERCGALGEARGSVSRNINHLPYGPRPTILNLRVPRWGCRTCGRVWRQNTAHIARPRGKMTLKTAWYALKSVVVDHLSISSVARNIGVTWHAANDAVCELGLELLIDNPARLKGVRVIGVDEHVWRHTPRGPRFVTVIIDATPIADKTGRARLLDMVEGRSKKVFKEWLAKQTNEFRDGIEIVTMDGFTGFKTAANEELPGAQTVMDPFHVVALAGDALDKCRQRIQQETLGRRGRNGDPLYGARKTLRCGSELLTEKQCVKLGALFSDENHYCLALTWDYYQDLMYAYRAKNRRYGKEIVQNIIDSLASGVPDMLVELRRLGSTLKRRAGDILAYFDYPHSSNGPTEAINGRLEHLRGSALGFRNLVNYRIRSLLETGGFKNQLHP